MRRYVAFIIVTLIVVVFAISCSTPYTTSIPRDDVKSMPPPPELKKKMCVGHDCRKIGAADITGTTRGHTEDEED